MSGNCSQPDTTASGDQGTRCANGQAPLPERFALIDAPSPLAGPKNPALEHESTTRSPVSPQDPRRPGRFHPLLPMCAEVRMDS